MSLSRKLEAMQRKLDEVHEMLQNIMDDVDAGHHAPRSGNAGTRIGRDGGGGDDGASSVVSAITPADSVSVVASRRRVASGVSSNNNGGVTSSVAGMGSTGTLGGGGGGGGGGAGGAGSGAGLGAGLAAAYGVTATSSSQVNASWVADMTRTGRGKSLVGTSNVLSSSNNKQ